MVVTLLINKKTKTFTYKLILLVDQHEIFLFWLLLFLLLLVFSWGIGIQHYSNLGVRPLHTGIAGLILVVLILLLKRPRGMVCAFYRYSIKVSDTASLDDQASKLYNQKKERKFFSKHLLIRRLPLVRRIIGWLVAERWRYVIPLFIVFVVGVSLRFYNLGNLSPAGDEYRHLMAMKHFITEGYYEYTDSHIITHILIYIRKITGSESLWLLRLPFAFFGSATILMFYFIGRKINKLTGLIAAYLFAFLPLAVGMSKYIRGYEFETFTAVLGLLVVLSRSCRRKPIIWLIALTVVLFLLDRYNHNPQFQANAALLILFAGIYTVIEIITRWFKDKKSRFIAVPSFLLLSLLVGAFAITKLTPYHTMLKIESRYFYIFNSINSEVTWFLPFIPYCVIIFIILCGLLYRQSFYLVISILFTTVLMLYFYLYYFDAPRRFQVRYIYLIYPYLIILLSAGSAFIFRLIAHYFSNRSRYVIPAISIILFLGIFNPGKAIYFTLTAESGQMDKNTQLGHYDDAALIKYINEKQIDVSKVLTSVPGTLHYYYNQPFANSGADKKKYLLYPDTQDFELWDKEQIYSINGYWNDLELKKIKELVANQDIEYIIFVTQPKSIDFQNYKQIFEKKFPNIIHLDTIDANKLYGYYVYRVVSRK